MSSNENRLFNNIQNCSFVVTKSLKKIKGHIKEWALSFEDWHTLNSSKKINLEKIDNSSDSQEIYYKERWIKENGIEQRLIISYSPKYVAYQRSIRASQIVRVQELINHPSIISKNRQMNQKGLSLLSMLQKMVKLLKTEKFHLIRKLLRTKKCLTDFMQFAPLLKMTLQK